VAHFILVPGAFHGGWCWERVVPLLKAGGHEVQTPNLPGTGADATPLTGDVLGRWARFIADLANAAGEPVILAGHSRGGIVISEAAELVPDRVARLVYVTALLLPAGATALGEHQLGDTGEMMTPLPVEAAQPGFYHLCSLEDARAAVDRLVPEPVSPLVQPLRLSEARFGSVPRAYIEAAEDRAITLDYQRAMQAALPCDPVITLQSDHSPFYSMPAQLAEALLSLV
jgi:pimeloyl-ACP methyl ester carboxylesterase